MGTRRILPQWMLLFQNKAEIKQEEDHSSSQETTVNELATEEEGGLEKPPRSLLEKAQLALTLLQDYVIYPAEVSWGLFSYPGQEEELQERIHAFDLNDPSSVFDDYMLSAEDVLAPLQPAASNDDNYLFRCTYDPYFLEQELSRAVMRLRTQ